MAHGGGKYVTQNKILPGYYFQFKSASKDALAMSDRGKVAVGLALDWGAEEKVLTVSNGQFHKDSAKYFGYDYPSAKLAPIREMFKNATNLIFYRLNGGGAKASCKWAKAKYSGVRGNDLTIVISGAVDEPGKFDVFTYLKDEAGHSIRKDKQRVATLDEIVDNDFVEFVRSSEGVAGVYKLDILTPLATGDTLKIDSKTYAFDASAGTAELQAAGVAALFTGDTNFDVVTVGGSVMFIQKAAGTGDIPVIDASGVTSGSVKISTVTDGVAAGTAIALAEDAGTPLTGGTNGTVTGAAHQDFLAKLERVFYHTLICNSTDDATMTLYEEYQKRMCGECGKMAQLVEYGYSINGTVKKERKPDSYDIIVVENAVITAGVPEHYAVFWVGGAEAGCEVNKTVQNRIYNGEYDLYVDYTQDELALKLGNGKFVFHETINSDNESEIRVLDDVNSYVTVTLDENSKYKRNKLIRVLHQIITDIGATFNANWQGIVANDADGRAAFKGVIVKYLYGLQSIRAIENVDEDSIMVDLGDTDPAVFIAIPVDDVALMFQCYNELTVA